MELYNPYNWSIEINGKEWSPAILKIGDIELKGWASANRINDFDFVVSNKDMKKTMREMSGLSD